MVTRKKFFLKNRKPSVRKCDVIVYTVFGTRYFSERRKKKQNTKLVSKLHEVMCWEVLFYPHPL